MSYGHVTVGYGSPEQKDIEVEDYVKTLFQGDRYIHIAKLVDGSYCLTIENLPSSGRAPHQSMRVGEESFIALIYSLLLYTQVKGMDAAKLAEQLQKKGMLEYSVSDNLKPLNDEAPV